MCVSRMRSHSSVQVGAVRKERFLSNFAVHVVSSSRRLSLSFGAPVLEKRAGSSALTGVLSRWIASGSSCLPTCSRRMFRLRGTREEVTVEGGRRSLRRRAPRGSPGSLSLTGMPGAGLLRRRRLLRLLLLVHGRQVSLSASISNTGLTSRRRPASLSARASTHFTSKQHFVSLLLLSCLDSHSDKRTTKLRRATRTSPTPLP